MLRNNIFSTGAKKLTLYRAHVEKWISEGMVEPITLEIQPSEVCNHRCPNCQAKYALPSKDVRMRAKKGDFLDLSLLETIWDFPPQGIILSGNTGDPLLHPEIGSLLLYIKSHGVPIVIITNGQALSIDLIKVVLKTCTGVRISLDSFDDRSFLLTHGMNSISWNRLLDNIRNLVTARAKFNISKFECLIGVGFLTNQITKNWMVDATRLAKLLGVDYIQFRPFHYNKSIITRELKICNEFEDDNFHVFSSNQKYSKLTNFERNYMPCHAAWFYTVIDAKGDVYLCCHHVGNPLAKIDSFRSSSWEKIIYSNKRRQVISKFPINECIPNCRLHSQNQLLEYLAKSKKGIPSYDLDNEIIIHAPFL